MKLFELLAFVNSLFGSKPKKKYNATKIEYMPFHLRKEAQRKPVVPVAPRSTTYPPMVNGERPNLSSVYDNVLEHNRYSPLEKYKQEQEFKNRTRK